MLKIGKAAHMWVGANQAELDAFTPDVERVRKKALNEGREVTENGISQWINEHAVFDPHKEGSAAYVWHDDGNRIRMERTLITRGADGKVISEKSLGFVWRKWS
jgi:hypothetical protein